ncbi:hypothetical protein [Neorhodopirellula pilleata]|uniref:hypothetical protein n=1 Tax=Neorhodopirellula pilleata TaxID=2714738 RepID=UPI001E5EE7FC|nr:hypothetical protein [Neorhodopirellula pilleata]
MNQMNRRVYRNRRLVKNTRHWKDGKREGTSKKLLSNCTISVHVRSRFPEVSLPVIG